MARYIDAELALELHNGELWAWDVPDLKEFLAEVPTADVVPKSEVESLAKEVDMLKKDNEYILMQHRFQRRPSGDCWNDVIEKAKTEVAREIFEEIEKYSEVAHWNGLLANPVLCIGVGTLAELKKKYTGGENEY